MSLKQIHKSFVSGRFSLILSIFVFIGLRLFLTNDWCSGVLWTVIAVQMITALFLLYLTQTFVIIRQRTFLPAFFYLLFVGTNPLFFYEMQGSIVALIVTFCLFFLLQTYAEPQSQRNALRISLFLTINSFFWTPLLLFFPLFWLGMGQMRSLNFRTFFASVIGFCVVYLFLFTWSLYKNDLTIFLHLLPKAEDCWEIHSYVFNLQEWIIIGFLAILYSLSGLKIFTSAVAEKLRTITILGYLYVFAFVVFVLFILQSEWETRWALILFLPLSILVAHFFTLAHKKSIIRLFIFTIIFFLGMLIIYNL
jgi:hypothetical protein